METKKKNILIPYMNSVVLILWWVDLLNRKNRN